jgi:alcohol dehydrogenase class IV
LTGQDSASPEEGIEWRHLLCPQMQIPSLSAFGHAQHDLPDLAAKALKDSSMNDNPIQLTVEELIQLLTKAL